MFPWLTKRRVLAAIALMVACVGWFLVSTVESILWPRQEIPEQADAIVILAGGQGERVVFGLAAAELGIADAIIVSTSSASIDLCAGRASAPEVQVFCVEANGGTDVEAAQLAAIAEANGYESLLLVTSNYHMQRAERWLRRCFDGEVFPLAADATPTRSLIRHELVGTAAQLTYQRSCPKVAEG